MHLMIYMAYARWYSYLGFADSLDLTATSDDWVYAERLCGGGYLNGLQYTLRWLYEGRCLQMLDQY